MIKRPTILLPAAVWGSVVLASTFLGAGEAPPPSAVGCVYYSHSVADPQSAGGRRMVLEPVPREGEEPPAVISFADKIRGLFMFRATSAGTILYWEDKQIREYDRTGKVVWELSAEKVKEGGFGGFSSVDLLPSGNFVVTGRDSPPAEVDRQGKVLRRLPAATPLISVRVCPDGHLLGVTDKGEVVEMDWEGKILARVPHTGDTGVFCHDAAKQENGHYLVVGERLIDPSIDPGPGYKGKKGTVAEIDREGRIVWAGFHGCPRTVQILPDEHLLVGAS